MASATDPTQEPYRVWRKHPDGGKEQSEKQAQSNRGWWWFTLDCNCPAIVSSGYAVCWHKAAVRLWQLHYQRRDGRAWGTLPAHSNAVAQANAAIDPDGVEVWKDKEGRVREPDVYCDCPDDPCPDPDCPCEECARNYDGREEVRAIVENTRRLSVGIDLPW